MKDSNYDFCHLSGIGTILVVLLVACFWPEMRHLSSLRETSQEHSQ